MTCKGATHCDNCGCTWIDDGLNPIGCPYCRTVTDDDVRNAWIAFDGGFYSDRLDPNAIGRMRRTLESVRK